MVGCTAEPALDRCNAFDAGASNEVTAHGAIERAMVSRAETIIAIADSQRDRLTYVHRQCPAGQTVAHCGLAMREVDVATDAILLTGDGRWITYTHERRLHRLDTRAPDDRLDTGLTTTSLVGALRSGAWVIVRFRQEYGLRAANAENGTALELDDQKQLLAVALGDRSIIARERVGGREQLFIAQVNPAYPDSPDRTRARLVPIGDVAHLDRVVITRGATPAALGATDAVDPDLPLDRYVIVTSSEEAPSAGISEHDLPWMTQVFDADTGGLVASFNGRVASGDEPLVELPGVAAIAPDQRHIAYVAPGGALALHDLDAADSCRVRASTSARHDIAGFAGDGTLFFRAATQAARKVFSYQGDTLDLQLLTGDRHDQSLAAVPMHDLRADGGDIPWAITAGRQSGLGYRGAAAGQDSVDSLGRLPANRTTFLPLDDAHLWTVSAEEDDDGDMAIELRRVVAQLGTSSGAQSPAVSFAADVAEVDRGGDRVPFTFRFPVGRQVCISIARVGEWFSRCTSPQQPEPNLDEGIPNSEL